MLRPDRVGAVGVAVLLALVIFRSLALRDSQRIVGAHPSETILARENISDSNTGLLLGPSIPR
ncbi:hypothetical protein AUI06_12115 [archaeon 13_2_20CM_2_52_21]|nr:MAG: hypothetical protein AUI06_12115 [archaeon 13_2_20CM_2_52_21]